MKLWRISDSILVFPPRNHFFFGSCNYADSAPSNAIFILISRLLTNLFACNFSSVNRFPSQ
jgi:hypothetical protein